MKKVLFLLIAIISFQQLFAQEKNFLLRTGLIQPMRVYDSAAVRTLINGKQASGSYVPTSRTLTINGTTYDLSANRSWTISGGSGSSSPNIVYLSQSGIISDAETKLYSTTFGSDQTAAIQAILDAATDSLPLVVVWDVKVSVTGLNIKSNTRIIAIGENGAILRNNSDSWLLSSYNKNQSAIADSNISIIGGVWNGNGFNSTYPSGAQTGVSLTTGFACVFYFAGAKNIDISDATVYNSRLFGMIFLYTEHVNINHITIDQGYCHLTQDGIDVLAYCKDFTVKNSSIRAGDDRFAFGSNPAIGNGLYGDRSYYTNLGGDQVGIRIENINFNGPGKGFRFNSSANKIQDVSISNIYGEFFGSYFVAENLDLFGTPTYGNYTYSSGPGDLRNFTLENIDLRHMNDSVSETDGRINIACNIDNFNLRNITRNDFNYNYPTIAVHKPGTVSPVVVKNINLDTYYSYEDSTTDVTSKHIYIRDSATVTNLNIRGAYVKRYAALNASQLIKVDNGASLTNLKIDGAILDKVGYIYGSNIPISLIQANHILHTNGYESFVTASTITKLNVSNWVGTTVSSGTVTTSTGDAFPPNVFGSNSTFNTSNDRLGIGTVSPSQSIHAYGSNSQIFIDRPSNAGGNYAFMDWGSGGTRKFLLGLNPDESPGADKLSLLDLAFSGSVSTITFTGGKVGIGTTSPNHKLDVVGNINVIGNIRDSTGYRISTPGYFEPTTGATITTVTGDNIINPAGTLATLTVNLPSSPVNGQKVHYTFTQIITALTFGNGTIVNDITTSAAGDKIGWQFFAATGSWYRY